MKDTHEDTGYSHKREEKRVAIRDYGKKAEAEKAKAELQKLKEQLKPTR